MPHPPTPPPLPLAELLPRLQALPRGATVLLLGGMDTGKTYGARQVVTAFSQAGASVAVLDCDLGQSEIGPPGTVGAGWAEPGRAYGSLRDLAPLSSYFVGAITPARHSLDVCVGAVQMARVAKKRRPDLVLVDTDGMISGMAGRIYKRRLAELLLPSVVLAFARGGELAPILTAFRRLTAPEVWPVAVAEAAQRKTPAARATRRSARFLTALEGAQAITLSLDDIALQGTPFGVGVALPHHLQQFLGETLRRPVLHAEQSGSGLYVVVNGERWDLSGMAAIESQFRTQSVTIVAAQKFARLLVGLVSSSGALLGIGLIERIEFARRTLTILTPCRRPAAIAQIWLGGLRLRPDGREIGEVKPGEV